MARHLFWSGQENYDACPQKYLWSHGFGTIDLGRGPGRGKLIPKPRKSEHHALMGNVISAAIEALYNNELWRDPPNLVSRLEEIVRKDFAIRLTKNHIVWSESPNPKWDEAAPREVLLQTCLDGVLNYLKTMKRNRLLGPYARSEVELFAFLNKYTPIAGRPDIILRRDDTGLSILDGKNSSTPGRYTNPDQLKWYALCFYLAHHTMPDRLAFIYFRFPEGCPPKDYKGDPETWTGLVEVPFTKDDLKSISHRAVETHKAIMKELFDPTPSSKACQFCDFKEVCDAHLEQKAVNARKPKAPKTEAEIALASSTGIMDLGFFVGPNADSKP